MALSSIARCLVSRFVTCAVRMLTYMSIRDLVKERASTGHLVEILPLSGKLPHRPVYLAPSIASQLDVDWDDESDEALTTWDVRAALDRFIEGREVSAAFTPDGSPLFRRLRKAKFTSRKWTWEIRVKPQSGPGQVRIFGCFSESDTFIGFSMRDRDMIPEDMWDPIILETIESWEHMLSPFAPVESENIHEYFSEPVVQIRKFR